MSAAAIGWLDGDPMEAEVLVLGARGAFDRDEMIGATDAATRDRQATVQAFDPRAVYGAGHLEAAARRALRAHAEGRATARDLAVEIALYAAGTTQIDDSLATVGVPAEDDALVLAAVGPERKAAIEAILERLGLEPDDAVVTEDEAALDRLGIPKAARDAVDEDEVALLVVEHVALLDART